MYRIANEKLALEVSETGAEAMGLYPASDPERSLIWDGSTAWNRRAPVCFPWCGRLKDGYYEEAGARYPGVIHGLLKDLPHVPTAKGPGRITLEGQSDAETLKLWPWRFTAQTTHALEGDRVVTTVAVTNAGAKPLPFQLGFHTGLRCPFAGGDAEDYVIRFEQEEHAEELICDGGFLTGARRAVFTGQTVVPVERRLFDADSILLSGLKSRWIQLEEKATGRYLRMDVAGFPAVLLWSALGIPGFLCIEPWHGTPDRVNTNHTLWERPHAQTLEPGQTFTAVQTLTVSI